MKHLSFSVLCLAAALCWTACGSHASKGQDHNPHLHTEACDHAHDHAHEAHNHEAHNHEAHDHAHEGEIHFTREQARLAGLELYTVEERPFRSAVALGGRLLEAPDARQTLVATQAGVVQVNPALWLPGAQVRAGEVLARLSARHLSGGDPAEQAALDYTSAQKAYERAQALVRDTLISLKEFEQISLAYEQAALRYRAQAGRQTEKGVGVKAPFGGYVAECLVQSGDYVDQGTALVRVVRTQQLRLELQVPATEARALGSVQSARFLVPGEPQVYDLEEWDGKLLSTGRGTGGNGAYRSVVFGLRNPGALEPGTYVEAWLLSGPDTPALAVPVSALTQEQGLYFVYVQEAGEEESFCKREVVLGSSDGKWQQVCSGLRAGEKVVSQGVLQVRLAAAATVIPHGHTHNH